MDNIIINDRFGYIYAVCRIIEPILDIVVVNYAVILARLSVLRRVIALRKLEQALVVLGIQRYGVVFVDLIAGSVIRHVLIIAEV